MTIDHPGSNFSSSNPAGLLRHGHRLRRRDEALAAEFDVAGGVPPLLGGFKGQRHDSFCIVIFMVI